MLGMPYHLVAKTCFCLITALDISTSPFSSDSFASGGLLFITFKIGFLPFFFFLNKAKKKKKKNPKNKNNNKTLLPDGVSPFFLHLLSFK